MTVFAGKIALLDKPEIESIVDVQPANESLERRHIVRVQARNGVTRRLSYLCPEFILQHVSLAQIMPRHRLIHFGRHGAEVFADQRRPVAMRFEAQDRVELVCGITHVSALSRRSAFGNPV